MNSSSSALLSLVEAMPECNSTVFPQCWALCSTTLNWTKNGVIHDDDDDDVDDNVSSFTLTMVGGSINSSRSNNQTQHQEDQCDCSEYGVVLRPLSASLADGPVPRNASAFYFLVRATGKPTAKRWWFQSSPTDVHIEYELNQPAAAAAAAQITSCTAAYCLSNGTAEVLGFTARELPCPQHYTLATSQLLVGLTPAFLFAGGVIVMCMVGVVWCCVTARMKARAEAANQAPEAAAP